MWSSETKEKEVRYSLRRNIATRGEFSLTKVSSQRVKSSLFLKLIVTVWEDTLWTIHWPLLSRVLKSNQVYVSKRYIREEQRSLTFCVFTKIHRLTFIWILKTDYYSSHKIVTYLMTLNLLLVSFDSTQTYLIVI